MMQDRRARGAWPPSSPANWLDFRRFEEHNAVDRERFPSFTNELRAGDVRRADPFLPGHRSAERLRPRFPVRRLHVRQSRFWPGTTACRSRRRGQWTRVDDARQVRARRAAADVGLPHQERARACAPARSSAATGSSAGCSASTSPRRRPTFPVLPTDETKLGDLTLREALAQHRANPACAGCHDEVRLVRPRLRRLRSGRRASRPGPGGRAGRNRATFPDGSEGSGLEGLRAYHARTRTEAIRRQPLPRAPGLCLGPQPAASDEPLLAEMRRLLVDRRLPVRPPRQDIVTSPQFLTKRGDAAVLIAIDAP